MIHQTGTGVQTATGLQLVKKPVQRAEPMQGLREGSTGRVVVVPRVWAVAEMAEVAELVPDEVPAAVLPAEPAVVKLPVELAFYRKYTEALLRRYLRLSMQSGRVPSVLSRDLFRGHVTRYSVRGFEDVMIFCHDVEQRLARLSPSEQKMITKVVLQRYTQDEMAAMLGISLRTCVTRYAEAVDRLTRLLLDAGLLDTVRR